MQRLYFATLAIAGLMVSGSASAQAFQNGSFEKGSFSYNPAGHDPLGPKSTALTGWTITTNGNGANVDWDRNGNEYGLVSSDGDFSLDLSGTNDIAGNGVRQTFDTLLGHTYSLSFDVGLNTRYTSNPGSAVQAKINGASLFTVTNNDFSQDQTWVSGSNQFTATSDSTILDLVFAAGGNYTGLDNVRVADLGGPLDGAVPEPASWAMMIGGFGAIGVAMRRRGKVNAVVSPA